MTKRVPIIALTSLLVAGCIYFWAVICPTLPYVGVWNYDQPDLSTDVNVAHLKEGGYSAGIPQIGQVTFSRAPNGEILGHTDQGCTWRFRVSNTGLHLSSSNQYCFNRVANLAYTIQQWDVSVNGEHEQETIRATSYLPTGTYDFVLTKGKRTKIINDNSMSVAQRFTGRWAYTPASLSTQFNMMTTVHISATTPPDVRQQAIIGTVTYAAGTGNTLTVTTPDGCKLLLEAHGNTAELMPSKQTCHTTHGEQQYSFWATASDGRQQMTMVAGTNEAHDNFLLIVGSLVKQ